MVIEKGRKAHVGERIAVEYEECSGIRDSGPGVRDSGFGIRDSGLGIRDSGKQDCRLRTEDRGLETKD